MADSNDTARRTSLLAVRLPIAQRLLSVAEVLDALAAENPALRMTWLERITAAVGGGQLLVRYANGLTVQPGTVGATHNMGTHFLCADIAVWLRAEGWTVTLARAGIVQPGETRPAPAQRFQEQEILRVIGELDLNPMAIPREAGKAGAKAEVRKHLPFTVSVFNGAWARLRAAGSIADAPKPDPDSATTN
jgi:hypothetical protein